MRDEELDSGRAGTVTVSRDSGSSRKTARSGMTLQGRKTARSGMTAWGTAALLPSRVGILTRTSTLDGGQKSPPFHPPAGGGRSEHGFGGVRAPRLGGP